MSASLVGSEMCIRDSGIGTARAIEIGAVEGALSGLAMALMGLATALLMPLMERYLY